MRISVMRSDERPMRRLIRLAAVIATVAVPLIGGMALSFAADEQDRDGQSQDPARNKAKACLTATGPAACNDLVEYCSGAPERCGAKARCIIECGTRLMLAEQKKSTGGARSGGDGGGRTATGAPSEARPPKTGRSKDESTAAGNAAAARKFQDFLQYKNFRDKGILD